jgi:hypothetical protein
MGLVWSPVGALNNLVKLNPKVALPLVAGMAAIAAVAIVGTWKVDVPTMALMSLYIIGLGLRLIVLGNVVKEGLPAKVLGWFVTILIIATISVFFVSAVFRQQGVFKPVYCLTRFWEPCEEAEAAVVKRNAVSIMEERQASDSPAAKAPSPPAAGPSNHAIYIQFAGLMTRESVTALNSSLRSAGWQVMGQSGDRIPDAQGLNEVRYASPADRSAAEALASAITAAGITSAPVEARQFPVGRTSMEVWISN